MSIKPYDYEYLLTKFNELQERNNKRKREGIHDYK